jgi:glycerol-3-phosphate dehydrogenase
MNDDAPVVIIGGGVTGTGIVRDCAMRGISSVLVEQGDLATGSSGRFHGLLHSGARYAVKDPVSARECMEENRILKHIAPASIENTGGFFIALSSDDALYRERWLKGCKDAGIATEEVSVRDLRRETPFLSSQASVAFKVPDASVDGFSLAASNAAEARKKGAIVRTYARVTGFRLENREIVGVNLVDMRTGAEDCIECSSVINAAGPWAGMISHMAGMSLPLSPDKGIMVIFHHRFTERVLNRLQPPGDGDIFVPHGTVTIFGTTSKVVTDPEDTSINLDEVLPMLARGRELIPDLDDLRIIRAFAGLRPLYRQEGSGEGREATREFILIDHEQRGGPPNMLSVIGGKLTTYRLMAKQTVDRLARKIGNDVPCRTDSEIMGSVIEKRDPLMAPLICECERVTGATVSEAAHLREGFSLGDIRRLTRLGMGPCQGTFCTYRAAGHLAEGGMTGEPLKLIRQDLQERWKGNQPVLWHYQARQNDLARRIYLGLLNMERVEQ